MDLFQCFSRETINEIFEQSFNAIVITKGDTDFWEFIYVNKAFTNMTGYTMDDLRGKTPKILQGELSDKPTIERLNSALKKGEFFEGQSINYKKDGSTYHIEWNISPIKDSSGKIVYFISFQRDISVRVEAEKAKDKILIQQSKMATLGRMIEAITHQLKQPMSVINLSVENLYFEDDKSMNEHFLNIIESQVKFMSNTLDEFKNFLSETKLAVEFSILKVIQTVTSILNSRLKYIDLNIDIDENIIVVGYPNEFKHAVINIINNALDEFAKKDIDEPYINIYFDKDLKILYIIDNAGGIPTEIIDKIFDLHFSTKKDSGGDGVGLYLTKIILNKIGVDLRVENEVNGAKFMLDFSNSKIKLQN